MNEYGSRIRAIRQQQGVRQEDMAAALGVSRTQVSNIERGTTDTSVTRLIQIAAVLGVSPAAFFTDEDSAPGDMLPFDDISIPLFEHLPFTD